MAIVSVRQTADEVGEGYDANARTATDSYIVVTSGPTQTSQVLFAPGIPRWGDPHPRDGLKRASKFDARQRKGQPDLWDVTVEYEAIVPQESDDPSSNGDPLSEPKQVSWSDATTTEPIDVTYNERIIQNTVEEPFDPPIQIEVVESVCTIVRNESAFDARVAEQYKMTVNADRFLECEPGLVRCNSITATKQFRTGWPPYWQVTYQFQIRSSMFPHGWRRRIKNDGTREWVGLNTDGTKQYRTILDQDGNPLTRPVPLSIGGRKLAASEAIYWLYFDVYQAVSYSPLGLGE